MGISIAIESSTHSRAALALQWESVFCTEEDFCNGTVAS
jgi:hypothetical protein